MECPLASYVRFDPNVRLASYLEAPSMLRGALKQKAWNAHSDRQNPAKCSAKVSFSDEARKSQCPSGGHTPASVTAHLSQQLRDLEDEVETKHFVRSKSGVRLTEPGRTFLKEARSILTQSQRAVQLAQAASRGAGRKIVPRLPSRRI